jgi:hypothetical protein
MEPNREQILKERVAIQQEQDPQRQAAYRELARRDVIYFINHFGWTFSPWRAPHHFPLVLWEFQVDYIWWILNKIQSQQDGLTEKTRDIGVSWSVLSVFLWAWIFWPSFEAMVGSRKEDDVDSADPRSLFWKMDYALKRMPAWILPKGFDIRTHRTRMNLLNPESGNVISGDSANPNFGRGGRKTAVLLDEFAFWEYGEQAWRGLADTTRCRLAVSTPNPLGGQHFKRLRYSGLIDVKTLHWRSLNHPLKDEEWYQHELTRRTVEEAASELDINYELSIRGRVYPEWDEVKKGNFPYVRGWPTFVSWDEGLDAVALIWWQRNPETGKYRAVDCYQNSEKTIDFYAPFITGDIPSGLPYRYTEADLEKIKSHEGWAMGTQFGDPSGENRNVITRSSPYQELEKYGIYVNTRPDKNTFEVRRRETQLFMRELSGVNAGTCAALDDAMTSSRFPSRDEGSQATSEINKPIHDWTSHLRTSMEYMAVNRPANEAPRPFKKPQRFASSKTGY